jgi:hypothetical protein
VKRLDKVKKGRLLAALRLLFYGTEGVGKTFLASFAPKPIIIDVEDGSGRLDIARYQFTDDEGGHVPRSFTAILEAIDDLMTSEHDYQTLIIDTADRLEALMWSHMLARDSKNGKALSSIEDYGYGKGYVMAVDEWRGLAYRLDRLRMARKMNIIILAHAQIRTFRNPTGEDYDRFQLRLNEKAAGFLREWVDVLGFAVFDEGSGKLPGEKGRPKGFSTGRRLLKFERQAAFDAKSRLALPAEVEMDAGNPWAPLAAAIEAGVGMDEAELRPLIEAELARIGDAELSTKATIATAKASGDPEALNRIYQSLKKRAAATTEEVVTNG